MKKSIIAAALLTISGFAVAAPMTSTVPLNGGTIAPHGTLNIALTNLMSQFTYNVTCTINDPNNGPNPVTIGVGATYGNVYMATTYLNGNPMSLSQAALPAVNTTILFTYVAAMQPATGNITISSADQTDTISVSNCSATAVTSSTKHR